MPINKANVLHVLADHVGKDHSIQLGQLVALIAPDLGPEADYERVLCDVIAALRKEGRTICGTPQNGYYVAATWEDETELCESLFTSALSNLQQVAALRTDRLRDPRVNLEKKLRKLLRMTQPLCRMARYRPSRLEAFINYIERGF